MYWCLELFLSRILWFCFWTSWDFCQLISPACQGPSGWLWFASYCSQFWVIHEFTKGALYPIIQVINEDVKQHWSQYWLLAYFLRNWSPLDFAWLTITLWVHPFRQFFIYLTVCSSSSYSTASLWESHRGQCQKPHWSPKCHSLIIKNRNVN